MSNKVYGIKEAAVYLGIDQMYMRKLLRDGKIPSTMQPVKPGSEVHKHVIAEKDLEAWKVRGRSSSSRQDGRNKWVVYATKDEAAKLVEFCKANGLPEPVMPNAGEYERRKAKAAAQ